MKLYFKSRKSNCRLAETTARYYVTTKYHAVLRERKDIGSQKNIRLLQVQNR